MHNKYIKRCVLIGLALFSVASLVGCSNPEPETVFYNGMEFDKDDLSMETLQWLEYYNSLDEMEQYALSYIPQDLMELYDQKSMENLKNKPIKEDVKETEAVEYDWGITLEATEVTAKGMTLVCHQQGGKNIVELNTGSFYSLQRKDKKDWVDVELLSQENEAVWDTLAWLIKLNDDTEWEISWAWLYGELPAGEYRIVKSITNFRGAGDYDEQLHYAEFSIE